MRGAVTRLRHRLRDAPLIRLAAIRILNMGRRPGHAPGVLILFYHDMRAHERANFARQLRWLRQHADFVGLTEALSSLDCPGGRPRICLTFDDARQGAFEHALPVLADQGVPATFFVVPEWIDRRRPGTFGWDACRALAAAGMEVGSHSMAHRRLADLGDAEARSELTQSRMRIEAELDRPCVHFACPWGQPGEDYRPERDPALARAAGYHSFATTIARTAAPGCSPFRLPRVRMEPGWGAAEWRYALLRQASGVTPNAA